MRYSRFHRCISIFLIGSVLSLSGCITLVQDLTVTPLDPHSVSLTESPPNLRVHSSTGGVLLFPNGAVFTADSLHGLGQYYGLNMKNDEFVEVYSYPLDMIVGMEAIGRETNSGKSVAPSVVGSLFLTAGVMGGVILIALSQVSWGGGGYCEQ